MELCNRRECSWKGATKEENMLDEGVTRKKYSQGRGIEKIHVTCSDSRKRPHKKLNMKDVENEEEDITWWLVVVQGFMVGEEEYM